MTGDELLYDPDPDTVVPPPLVLQIGARHGLATEKLRDALDLGCGTGHNLAALREALPGRIVGVDVSPRATALAQARAPNAEVRTADLTALNPADLGQFDVLYCAGVLYVVPPATRRHTLSLIRDCLRPGGLALLTYYSGAMHRLRAALHAWIRAEAPENLSAQAAIAYARDRLAKLARERIPAPYDAWFGGACADSARLPDEALWHEVFNPHFCALDTASLGAPPLRYLDDARGLPISFGSIPSARVLSSALSEAPQGSYCFSIFTRDA